MIVVEEKKFDQWLEWKPQWTRQKQTPYDMQESHSPTAHTSDERNSDQERRRIVDARLWEAMTPLQQEAAVQIANGFDMINSGIGYTSSNWQRIPGCRGSANIAEAHARLMNFYFDWARKCAIQKISHAMVVDVLCFGFPCRLIDRDRRLKNGTTRLNLMRGLSLYCELRGWV